MTSRGQAHPGWDLLSAGATLLAEKPLVEVDLPGVASVAGVTVQQLRRVYPSVADLSVDVLDHERASMRAAIQALLESDASSLQKVVDAFEMVGRNCANDIVVRAGVRLAAESRHHFPDRALNPFETWHRFVVGQLLQARHEGSVACELDIDSVASVIVMAGLGTRDQIQTRGSWSDAAAEMRQTGQVIVQLVSATPIPEGSPKR